MAHIDIQKDHDLGTDAAREKVTTIEPKLKEKFGVTLAWRGNEADVKGTGVSGLVRIEAQRLSLKLTLGLMLRPLTGKIRDAISDSLDKALRQS